MKAHSSFISYMIVVEKNGELWGVRPWEQATNALPLVALLDPGSHAPSNVPATQLGNDRNQRYATDMQSHDHER
ncbi:hypothetical protein PSPO01_02464 [Paraphaeosphaeria sporulosa]